MERMMVVSSDHLMKYHTIIDVSDWGMRFNTYDTDAPISFTEGHRK